MLPPRNRSTAIGNAGLNSGFGFKRAAPYWAAPMRECARYRWRLRDSRTNVTVKSLSTEEIKTQPESSRVDAFIRRIPSTSIR